MIESPKTRFQKDKQAVEKLADLVASESYQKAVIYTYAQLRQSMPEPQNTEEAASQTQRSIGALLFVRTFAELGEIPKPVPNQPLTKNLNWNA